MSAVRDVVLSADDHIVVGDSPANQGLIEATDARKGDVELTAHSINVSNATLRAGQCVDLVTRGDIVATSASIKAGGGVRRVCGPIRGHQCHGRTTGSRAGRELCARDQVLANDAFLLACKGAVQIKAGGGISLRNSVARAFNDLEVSSWRGNVDLAMADLASAVGSTRGKILLKGDNIGIANAKLVSASRIRLDGNVVGTAAEFRQGTKPCP